MRDELEARYRLNLQRVRGLVASYQTLAGPGQGRRPVETIDVLRAAVVFLHATMEDVLRTLLARRLRESTDPKQFEELPVVVAPGARPLERVKLSDLVPYRHETIDALVQRSVDAQLERSTFNNLGDVKKALLRGGIDPGFMEPFERSIAAMMKRRHQIAHRADQNEVGGSGNHMAASLGVWTVEAWIFAVEELLRGIVARV